MSKGLRILQACLESEKKEYTRLNKVYETYPAYKSEENKLALTKLKISINQLSEDIKILKEVHSIGTEDWMLQRKTK